MSRTSQVLLALVAGLALGLVLSAGGSPSLLALARWLEPLGALWVNALRMTVLPLILPALILGVNALPESGGIGRLGARSLAVFLGILVLAAAGAVLVGVPVFSRLKIPAEAAAALRAHAELAGGHAGQMSAQISTVGQWVSGLIPANPAQAAADGTLLPLIVCTLIFGLALGRIAPAHREPLLRAVRAVYETALVVVNWILLCAPLGVFALAVPLARQLGLAAAGAIAYYVVASSAVSILVTGLLYLGACVVGGQALRRFARAVLPAQTVAFSSRSSYAALPALLESADQVLGLPLPVRSFVLPLAAAGFRAGGAAGIATGVLFIARLYGVEPSAAQLATIVALSVITSVSAPGIPGGSILVMLPILLATHLPVAAVGLLLAADTIPDLFRTTANVTGDLAVATIIARLN